MHGATTSSGVGAFAQSSGMLECGNEAVSRMPLRRLNSRATLRELVQRLREGIYVTNHEGVILDANPAFLEMLGVSSVRELRRISAEDLLVHPEQREAELRILENEGSVRDFELMIRRPDGEVRTVLDTAYAVTEEGNTVLYHGILVDITRHKELERQLREQATRDPLTGCFNRRYLGDLARRSEPIEDSWGTIIIDIDHFKAYNDTYGHQAGDEILVKMSRFLMRMVRCEDSVIRIGGDEFLLFLEGADRAATDRVGGRLRDAGSRVAPVPFSLGWAVRKDRETLEMTIGRADHLLYRVRSEGRRYGKIRRRSPSRGTSVSEDDS